MGAPAAAAWPAAQPVQPAHALRCLYRTSWQAATPLGRLNALAAAACVSVQPQPRGLANTNMGTYLLIMPGSSQGVAGACARLAASPGAAALQGCHAIRVSLAAHMAAGPAACAARTTDLQVQALQAALNLSAGGGAQPTHLGNYPSTQIAGPAVQLLTSGAQPTPQPGRCGGAVNPGAARGGSCPATLGAAAAALLRVAAVENPAWLWSSADVDVACPQAAVPPAAHGGDVYGRSLQVWHKSIQPQLLLMSLP